MTLLNLTEDTFFNGGIKVFQHREGYRFSIDAVLLAAFSAPETGDRIVDLGTGCGIIPLILGHRHPAVSITGIEVQPELAELAARNVKINGLKGRITIIREDMRSLSIQAVSGPVDIVISNPPYRKGLSGRVNPHPQRAVARHEILATLQDVASAAARLLGIGGRFAIIYPAERITDLLTNLRSAGIEPKHIQTVHAKGNEPARLVLVSGIKGGRPGAAVHEPLVIYRPDGTYTDSVQAMFNP
ncbi:MAG: tRNA1(Val) (adenine(37)-N6)-methyltransferase [Deltaproteobacteria bacterium]|nr:tRNA1(Val) (adenine(37)-N6)-methyltransferase [Deltaproteobacteria bacterium]